MVDVIQKRNGEYVKLVCSSRRENKNYYLIQDEKGERTLDENQVLGEVLTVDQASMSEYPMHPKVMNNIKTEMIQREMMNWVPKNLIDLLRLKKIPYIDHRSRGGCLWIPHFEHIRSIMTFLNNRGYHFKYHSTSKALGNRAGWFLSDQKA